MKHTKKVLSGFIAMSMALPIAAPAELLSVSDVLTVKAADQQKTGKTADGYDYELWNQNYTGNVDMQLGSNGGFSCSWSGIENCLFRTGKKLGSTKGYKDYGNISIDYDVDYQPMGNSYMCVYGWTEDPTVEYYIVEAWGDWRPPGQQGGKGTVSADGKTYDIYTSTRVNQPSIHGTETFEQYWSVNKTNPAQVNAMKNLKGTITVSDHFAAWERSGMKMGKMYEVALNIEGYRSSGKANVKKNNLQIGGSRSSSTQPAASQAPVAKINGTPVSAGTGLSTDCESNAGGWTARGDNVSLLLSGDMTSGGSKALAVTGRSASWNGIQNASSDLKAGGSYSFSSSVGYKNDNYSSAGFTFGVQYDLGGETNYDNIADATASSGKMTKLAGDFKIPSGAENISLYVQTAYSENDTDADLIDFFIDDIKVTGDGSSSSTVTQPTSGNSTQPVSRPSSGGQEVNDGSLKGKFGACFKIGTSVSPHELGSGGDFIKKHFNSITPENELKPDALLSPGSDNTRAKVSLSKAAQTLKFCEQNGIALRGHTFVWYSQTPDWFFKENFSSSGSYVSKDIMNQRLENFIKDTFDLLAKEYPKLEVYAYDVCNELFVNDGGGLRPGSNSGWTKVYGDNNDEFIINAFTYARKYAPAGCKLYINDYNEYIPAKTNDIYKIAMKLKEKGVIDGIGMQSHLDIKYPSADVYKTGLEKFLSTGLEVQITELDITCGSDFNTQAKLFADVFQMAVDHADQIPALTVWGTNDSISWRRENNPLLFSSGYKAKPAFDAVMKVDTSSVKSSAQTPASQAPASQAPASQAPAQNPTQNIVQNPSTQAPAAADFKFGDLNDDGKIDITDLSILAVHLIDKTKFTDKQTLAADVAYNGKVELADLATLRQFISKVIDKLGEGYVAPKASPSPSPSPSQQPQQPSPSPSQQTQTPATFTSSGKTFSVGNGQTQHKNDNVDGYSYEIWLDRTGGSGSMTLGSGGTFSTEWSAQVSQGNFLARRGRNYDATKKATEYGPIVMDYAADYSASSQGNSRLCVYGWMKNPLVEYYIIEDWVNWCPKPNGASKTVTIDGAEYEIFQLDHTGPTILGTTETFKQYFSVRKSKRTSGTITVSDHFKAWAAAGWNIGNLTEVALNVEGWESSGKATVSKLTIGTGSGEQQQTTQNPQQGQQQNPGQQQQVPQQTAKSTGSKGKVQNGVWTSDADTSWIDPNKPMVAISFDDGPIANSQNPGRIHNALTKNGFHATFFYWGERIRGNEQEIKNAFNAGFEVANHTWTHPNLTQQGDKGKSEVQKTKQALDAIIGGDNDYLLRPPYLNFDASVGQAVGVPCPNCGLDTKDWDGASKDQIVNTLKSALANGSLRNKVVLCHENYDSTASAMEEFLPYLKSQGWQCVTVSEMFKAQGKTMQAGQLYNECK